MDVQLQELVNRIQKDGVESAEAQAAEIIRKAEEKAASIIASANSEADASLRKAQNEAARLEEAAVSAIKQAARNLLLSFRDGITAELDVLVKRQVTAAFSPELLKDLIPRTVSSWISTTGSDDIAVILSASDAEKLESVFMSSLKDHLSKGLVVRPDTTLSGGFHIGSRDGSSYYDFSAEAVADLFSSYLNPRVAAIMKAAAKEL